MPLSPNKANYFRPKHPSKSVDTKYHLLIIQHNWHLMYLHACISFHYIIRIKASHNNCRNLVSYQTRQHFWTCAPFKCAFDAQKYCLGKEAHKMLIHSQWFYGFHLSAVKQAGWKWIKDAEFFGNWVILQNRCHFCLSYTYVGKK